MILEPRLLSRLPQPFVRVLEDPSGEASAEEVADRENLLIDLWSRYILFFPLAYYFSLLRDPAQSGQLLSPGLADTIVAVLARRTEKDRAGTPQDFLNAAWDVVSHLVQLQSNSSWVGQLRALHQRFRRRGARGYNSETRKIFDGEAPWLASAKSVAEATAHFGHVRDHILQWLDHPLFESTDLIVRFDDGSERSLLGTQAAAAPPAAGVTELLLASRSDEGIRFSAAPFLRAKLAYGELSLLFLSQSSAEANGNETATYQTFTLGQGATGRKDLSPEKVSDGGIPFPWPRFKCSRRIACHKIVPHERFPVALELQNLSAHPTTVAGFVERFPAGTHSPDPSAETEKRIGQLTVPPYGRVPIDYYLVADCSLEEPTPFATKALSIEQGVFRHQVPIGGTAAIATTRAMPPEFSCVREVRHNKEPQSTAVEIGASLLLQERLTVTVTIANDGGRAKEMEFTEVVSGPAAVLSACAYLDNQKAMTHSVKIASQSQKTELAVHLPAKLMNGSRLTLEYTIELLAAGTVTLDAKAEKKDRRARGRMATPVAFHMSATDPGPAKVALAAARALNSPHYKDPLKVELQLESSSPLLASRTALLLRIPGQADRHIPVENRNPARTESCATIELSRRVSGELDAFSVEVVQQGTPQETPAYLFGPTPILRVWRTVTDLPGFQGRQDLLDRLRKELRNNRLPVFLAGEKGNGKGRLLEALGGKEALVDRIQISCDDHYPSPFSRLKRLVAALDKEVLRPFPTLPLEADPVPALLQAFSIDPSDAANAALIRTLHQRDYKPNLDDDRYRQDAKDYLVKVSLLLEKRRRSQSSTYERHLPYYLLLIFDRAAQLDLTNAKPLLAIYQELKEDARNVMMVFSDKTIPHALGSEYVPLTMRPWSRQEFGEICNACFIYPRLSESSVDRLFGDTRGNPTYTDSVFHVLQRDPASFFREVGEKVTLLPQPMPNAIPADLHSTLRAKLDALLSTRSYERMRGFVVHAIAMINLLETDIEKETCLKALEAFKGDKPKESSSVLDLLELLAADGWIGTDSTERFTKFGPAQGVTRREFIAQFAAEASPDRWLDVLKKKNVEQALQFFPGTDSQLRSQVVPLFLEEAERSLEGTDYDLAERLYSAFHRIWDSLDLSTQAKVASGGARLSWALSSEVMREAWLPRVAQIYKLKRPRLASNVRRALRAQLDLQSASDYYERHDDAKRALRTLSRWLIDGRLARRLKTRVGGSSVHFIASHFAHHLLGLEISFFSPRKRFQRIYRHMERLFLRPELTWHMRVQYVEALWRLSQDPQTLLRVRSDILKDGVEKDSVRFEATDRARLQERTEELYTNEKGGPLWLGRLHYQRWQACWLNRHVAGHQVFRDEDLLGLLESSISVFRARGARSLLASALVSKADFLLDRANGSPNPEKELRHNADSALREAARICRELGRDRAAIRWLSRSVSQRLEDRAQVVVHAVDRELQQDLEMLLSTEVLSDRERQKFEDAIIEVAYLNHDFQTVKDWLGKATAAAGRHVEIEYRMHKRDALDCLNQDDPDASSEAYRHLARCQELLRDKLLQTMDVLDGAKSSELSLDLPWETLWVECHLAKICVEVDKEKNALDLYREVFGKIAAHMRTSGDKNRTPAWNDLVAKASTGNDVVQILFGNCADLMATNALGFQERNQLFRQAILMNFNQPALLRALLDRHTQAMSGSRSPLEEIDRLLLQSEVSIVLGQDPGAPFLEACEIFSRFRLDEEEDIAYAIQLMTEILKITVKGSLDLSKVLEGFAAILRNAQHARRAARGLAEVLVEALAPLSESLRTHDRARHTYLSDFLARALQMLDSIPDENLDSDTLDALVRADLLLREDRRQTLHWMKLWVDLATERKDESAVQSSFSFLCMLLSSVRDEADGDDDAEKQADAVPPDTAANEAPALETGVRIRAEAMELCQKLIAIALEPGSWVHSNVRSFLLFNVAEKLLDSAHPTFQLATALALHRASADPDPIHLKILRCLYLDSPLQVMSMREANQVDGIRVGLLLYAMTLALEWPYESGRFSPESLGDPTRIWNLIILLRGWRDTFRFTSLPGQTISPRDLHFIRCFAGAAQINGQVWATVVARLNLSRWSAFGRLSPIEIQVVPLLAGYLSGGAQARSFEESYLWLQRYVEMIEDRVAQENQMQLLVRQYGGWLDVFRPEKAAECLRRAQNFGLEFVESACQATLSVGIDRLLAESRQLIAGTTLTTDQPIAGVARDMIDHRIALNRYQALVDYLVSRFPAAAVAPDFAALPAQFGGTPRWDVTTNSRTS